MFLHVENLKAFSNSSFSFFVTLSSILISIDCNFASMDCGISCTSSSILLWRVIRFAILFELDVICTLCSFPFSVTAVIAVIHTRVQDIYVVGSY